LALFSVALVAIFVLALAVGRAVGPFDDQARVDNHRQHPSNMGTAPR